MNTPVVFGKPNGTVVYEVLGGLQMPVPLSVAAATPAGILVTTHSGTSCPSVSFPVGGTPVRFGYDMATGCVMNLNRTELRNICCQGSGNCVGSYSSPYAAANGVPYFFSPHSNSTIDIRGFIGIYGNSDPLDVSQWLTLTQPVESATRRWNEISGTCSNMYSGMNYQFLVSRTGEKANPQNKIVSAAVSYSSRDWTMRLPFEDNVSKQAFALSVTVSFIFRDQELKSYNPPAPPVLFKVPYDVFYPFSIGNAAPRSSSLSIFSVLSCYIAIFLII